MFESEAAEALGVDPAATWFRERLAQTADRARLGPGREVVLESPPRARDAMPPLHARDEDETYQVLEGEVVFHVGAEVVHARAGDVVVAPRDVPRTYRVLSERARWLVVTALRSVTLYEDFQRAVLPVGSVAVTPDDWTSEDEFVAVAALAAANGIELLGPPGMLPRV